MMRIFDEKKNIQSSVERECKHNSFNRLPADLIYQIYSFATLEESAFLARIDTLSNKLISKNQFWENKYKLHFPKEYQAMPIKSHSFWKGLFFLTFKDQYRFLTGRLARLFSYVKENDVNALRDSDLHYDELDFIASNGKKLVQVIEDGKNQNILNYIYEVAIDRFIDSTGMTVDPTQRDSNTRSIFYWALFCNKDYITVSLLMMQGSTFEERYFDNFTPIHLLAKYGNLDLLSAMIRVAPEYLNVRDAHDETPLSYAAYYNHLPMVQFLVQQKGIDLNPLSRRFVQLEFNDLTPLTWAIERGHTAVALALIKAGADLEPQVEMQIPPLHYAADKGNLRIVKSIIEKKQTLINKHDFSGQTVLHYATAAGNIEMVQYLMSRWADLDAVTLRGRYIIPEYGNCTALHYAIKWGHVEIAKLLIRANASQRIAAEPTNLLPIHLAAKYGYVALIELILTKQPNLLNEEDMLGQTPLIWAASGGHYDIVKFLLQQKGINLHATTRNTDVADEGRTAFQWAVKSKAPFIPLALIEAEDAKSILQHPLYKGEHPIHTAARLGLLQSVRAMLIKQPALINLRDRFHQTPLMLAAEKDHKQIVEYLLEQKGVDIDAVSRDVNSQIYHLNTALYFAALEGNDDVVKQLLKAGAKTKTQKPIMPHMLEDETKWWLALARYIEDQDSKPDVTQSCSFFSVKFQCDYSKHQKIAAALAMKSVVFYGRDRNDLLEYMDVINNTKLRMIYENLKLQPPEYEVECQVHPN